MQICNNMYSTIILLYGNGLNSRKSFLYIVTIILARTKLLIHVSTQMIVALYTIPINRVNNVYTNLVAASKI